MMLVGGASVGKTAKALFMSESTVKTHVGKVYDKLDAHNRAEAVMAAVRLGLVKTTTSAARATLHSRSPADPTPRRPGRSVRRSRRLRTSRRQPSAGSCRGR